VQPEPAEVVRAAAPSCHETSGPLVPEEPQENDGQTAHCSHDHSTSVRPAPKPGLDIATLQPFALVTAAAPHPIAFAPGVTAHPRDVSRGSPPILITLPLRI
jgi:hypothetical protein